MIPIQLLTLGHTVRVCYDLTNYAELSINSNGDLTIHKLCGINPKIIDKTVTNETFTTPPTDRPLKVGDVLVCHKSFRDYFTNGKEYVINGMDDDFINVIDNTHTEYYFFKNTEGELYYKNYFTLKP